MASERVIIASLGILVIGGVGIWWAVTASQPQTNSPAETAMDRSTDGSLASSEIKVDISGSAYSPSHIIVKKGTTVTWTNKDAMGHNVVAKNPDMTGGLPVAHPLLSKGQTFSLTFDVTGTFEYTCTPHPFMLGSVEVVD